MIIRVLIICAAFETVSVTASAQSVGFKAFHDQVMNDYGKFRKRVLDDYATFLAGVWKEYETFKGESKYNTPKPQLPPIDDNSSNVNPIKLSPVFPDNYPINESPTIKPVPTIKPIVPTKSDVVVDFYGIKIKVPYVEIASLNSLESDDIANAWKNMQKRNIKDNVIHRIQQVTLAYGLNDWLTLTFVRRYAANVAPERNSRILLTQFIIANMGYNVRIAKTDRQLLLAVNIQQKVYHRSYTILGQEKYYLFEDDIEPIDEGNGWSIQTCELPQDADLGKSFDMVIHNMKVDVGSSRTFSINASGIQISGTVDETVMKILDDYPSIDIPNVAESNVLPALRKDIINQIKSSIDGKNEVEAVRAILHFVQRGFKYATDEEQHGHEKYYYVEENLYYPMNDCEDRAIFFAYIIHSLLGLDVHLLYYPGHECTAVKFNTMVEGDSYVYNNGTFTICDPTYIGADIGRCMPQYRQTQPKIELWY